MHSIIDSNETAKQPMKSSSDGILDDTLSREADEADAAGEAAKGVQERALRASNEDGSGSGEDEPPTSGGASAESGFIAPQFAIRIGDGAMLMAVDEHANDRDLTGRETWTCLVLTPEEAESARQSMETAEQEAASRIAVRLPRKQTH